MVDEKEDFRKSLEAALAKASEYIEFVGKLNELTDQLVSMINSLEDTGARASMVASVISDLALKVNTNPALLVGFLELTLLDVKMRALATKEYVRQRVEEVLG